MRAHRGDRARFPGLTCVRAWACASRDRAFCGHFKDPIPGTIAVKASEGLPVHDGMHTLVGEG